MTASTDVPAPPINCSDSALAVTLDRLWPELSRLQRLELSSEAFIRIADRIAALRYLLHAAPDRPMLVGLVGGASCGKSTLFDSLIARPLSRIHYQPHSSLGPVVWLHRSQRGAIGSDSKPSRFLPMLTARELEPSTQTTVGAVSEVILAIHEDHRWRQLAITDLPDISSESARREGWLVRRLLPWLDLVIWMVDPNDYLFEDLYIDLIDEVSSLGQRSIVVVNDIHGQLHKSSQVVQDRIRRFRPDTSFVLPRLECRRGDPYPLFQTEPEFARLQSYLESYRTRRPVEPLIAQVRQDAATVLHSNAEWSRLIGELRTGLSRLLVRHRNRILASAPLLSVLPEPAQQELERLRNRLSLWHQGKRLFKAIRSPARIIGQAAFRQFELTADDLNTEPLYRHLVGTLKEFGVDLHRTYLESRFVEKLQARNARHTVLGSFEPESLGFQNELDQLARHVFVGAQQMLSDPALLKDKRFHFVVGATGVALVFLAAESMLGMVGLTLLVGKGLTALAAVLSPELARYLPLDRMSRLAIEARNMLSAVIDQQMQRMVEFYAASDGLCLEPGDRLLTLLESMQQADTAKL